MRAMVMERVVSLAVEKAPLRLVELPRPEPAADEVLVRVRACGVCHTELDELEGRTPPPSLPVVPGHEIVGIVAEAGSAVTRHRKGDRVGVGWIHRSSGEIDENLSPAFCATGRDANGGYAEYVTVGERYAYPVPLPFSDAEAAPLLCAGAVGYRALRLTGLQDGELLGLTGFGGSGHLMLQLARHLYPSSRFFVFARSERQRAFALESGACWAGGTTDRPPEPLHAIVDTTPAWLPVLAALLALRPGGRLVINAIRKEDSDRCLMAGIDYPDQLWREKELKSVANVTARDIAEFLPIAAAVPLAPRVRTYRLEQANEALLALWEGGVHGALVLDLED